MFKIYGAVGALLLSAGLQAAVIPGLFNTGVTSPGVQVLDFDNIADPHWQQNGTTAFTFNINRAGFGTIYIPEILPSPGSNQSRWISVDGFGNVPTGTPSPFTLSFDLTGFDQTTASFSGRWAADNCGNAQLNGVTFSTISTCSSSSSFTQWTPFSSAGGFLAGVNTLTFNLTNQGGPGAIRIEFLSSDAMPNVPEPGTYALMGTALVALGWMRNRKRQ